MDKAEALAKVITDGLKVRDAMEHAQTGDIIALVKNGYISRSGDTVVSVIDGIHTTVATDARQIITAAARGGNIVLLFADGELRLLGRESVQLDFTTDEVFDSVNRVYLVSIIVATDRPEAIVIVGDTATWVAFGTETRVLDVEPGTVFAFHQNAVCALSPVSRTAAMFVDGTKSDRSILVPDHGEWKFATSCGSHVIVVTETSVLVYSAAFDLKTIYRIWEPVDVVVADCSIYIATMMGELLCAPLDGGAIISCGHIPSVHLNMRINYDAGSVLCRIADTKYAVLACNTRKLYEYCPLPSTTE